MRLRTLLSGSLIVAATAAACSDAANNTLNGSRSNVPPVTPPVIDGGGTTNGDGINTTGSGAGTGAVTGLPCDVQQLLENRCIGCHLGTSPPPLLTYDDLIKHAPTNPTKTIALVSLERMKSTTAPM